MRVRGLTSASGLVSAIQMSWSARLALGCWLFGSLFRDVRFEAGLHVDAVDPEVDVTFGREIARGPPDMLVRPGVLQSGDARGGYPPRIRAEQSRERVLKVAAGDAP